MLKTFRIGGVHPPENKLSAGQAIINAELPKQAVVMLSQHIGAPAQAVVAKGDKVKVGTLLAQAGGFVSANIHSPVSGTVAKIDTAVDAAGYQRPAIFIDVEGDEWEEIIDRSETLVKECKLDAKAIIDRIKECGIVGLGGATFPTHVKTVERCVMKATILIINGVECEPYLTSDHQLMMEKGEEILVGVEILRKAINVERAVIGIENNKPDAIKHMQELATNYPAIEICPLKVKYPQGGEKQLIDAIIRRQVPSGGLPIATGAVVQNVGTAFAVYEAVQKNKPLVERIVTVTGKSLAKPSNLRVRIGTPISQLIDMCGGLPLDTEKVISGGPMMGKAVVSTDMATTKGCSGVLLIRDLESRRQEMQPCIRCAKCVSACPMGLAPNVLAKAATYQNWECAEEEHVMDCIECGSCSFTCPAHRPLLDFIRQGKAKVGAIIRSRNAK